MRRKMDCKLSPEEINNILWNFFHIMDYSTKTEDKLQRIMLTDVAEAQLEKCEIYIKEVQEEKDKIIRETERHFGHYGWKSSYYLILDAHWERIKRGGE